MGCINSKYDARNYNPQVRDPSARVRDFDGSLKLRRRKNRRNRNHGDGFHPLEKIRDETGDGKSGGGGDGIRRVAVESSNRNSDDKQLKRYGIRSRFRRSVEGEEVAAGWPAWLRAAAGEAVDGWLPLKSENYERLEKIGQGTYSSVYRARDLQTGRIMALKKVRFDNFEPESVRFMAREIKILRRLDHPNVMKLEGIITSKLSCNIYLVFEYMEHDLSGLLSCPDVEFTDSRIKCYMSQLLKGIEHCHSQGVLHRDIKSSNILINNEGVLKIADFGLASFFDHRNKQPLTNRVVTLWYRPPELLLGSTSYGASVDMWSVGCVFAELFVGRPILKGRTEVEQLHNIFKLCGSPSDEYWKKSRLPLAPVFRSQCVYESSIRELCKELPKTTVDLISTLLSVEPEKRITATSALEAEYFNTKPYACDPASMPTYPPNKEIDAKFREATGRHKGGGRVRASGGSRNLRNGNPYFLGSQDSINSKTSYDTVSDASGANRIGTLLPAQTMASNGRYMWEAKRKEHMQRRQSQPDFLSSAQAYSPQVLSYDHQEQKQSWHRRDVRRLDYYPRAAVHRPHSSIDAGIYRGW